MKLSHQKTAFLLIAAELAVGVLAGVLFINGVSEGFFDSNSSYGSGLIRFFVVLSLLFFASVLLVGIPGAIYLGQKKTITNGIYYAVIFWFLTIILYIFTINFFTNTLKLGLASMFLILVGIVSGYNFGLRRNLPKRGVNL
jgi:hypothetical protein